MHLVGWQVVHHDHIAGREAGNENLLDIDAESVTIHRAVKHPRRYEAAVPQPRREVVVFQWPWGTVARQRSPFGARP